MREIKVERMPELVRRRKFRLALRPIALICLVLTGMPLAALAHGMSAGDKPLVSGTVSLKHLRAGELISLFAREQLPAGAAKLPRAARAGTEESLLPTGVDALLPTRQADTVTLVGNEDVFFRLNECLRVLDVPIEDIGRGRQRVVLTLQHAEARTVRAAVLKYPGRGAATVNGRQLILEGTAEWLHLALRQVIRGELQEPKTSPPPTL